MAVVVKRIVECDDESCHVEKNLKIWGTLSKKDAGTRRVMLCTKHYRELDALWKRLGGASAAQKRKHVPLDLNQIPKA